MMASTPAYAVVYSRPIYSREPARASPPPTFRVAPQDERFRQRDERERRAVRDAASRRRQPPRSGAPMPGTRLPTHDDAIAARMAARRTA